MRKPALPEHFKWLVKLPGKSAYGELLILLAFVLVITFVIKTPSEPIRADGAGYFDYLPSLFEHKDLVRKNYTREENPELYERISKMGMYVDYKEFRVNKYHCGTAVLISPFYFAAGLFTKPGEPANYEIDKLFQMAVYLAALFYLFFSLIFLRKLLKFYQISHINIFITQILLVFATAVIHYAAYEASFSHIYSLFAISAFLYTAKAYFMHNRTSHFLWSCLSLGLITILRPVNLAVILFLPFLAGSFESLTKGALQVLKSPLVMLAGLLLACAVISIQFVFWYLQVGEFLVYSYQNEGFNFLNPEITYILFSYQKGLFIYTPVLLLAALGLIRLLRQSRFYLVTTWLLFFLILTYILSSWHNWYYGASYGMRVYVEFYPVFFILFALLIENLRTSYKALVLIVAFAFVPLNLIQAMQYKKYILHWYEMDKAKYWRVFLKTDKTYKGLLWKTQLSKDNFKSLEQLEAGDFKVEPRGSETIFRHHINYGERECKARNIQVSFENEFNSANRALIALEIINLTDSLSHFYYNPSLIRFYEEELNTYHRGLFNFSFSALDCSKEYEITVKVYAFNKTVKLDGVVVDFMTSRWE
jgi:hypothetical protein